MSRHMDHFRNARLYQDENLHVESIEGFMGCREKAGRRKEWHGYFLVDQSVHLEPTVKYSLVLDDGSTATIRACDLEKCEEQDKGRHAVEFYVVGELRAAGRRRHGLESSGRRPLSS